jgi:hypothetical protein
MPRFLLVILLYVLLLLTGSRSFGGHVPNGASSWMRQYCGHARALAFLTSAALVQTDNELVLLNLTNGDITWRREIGEHESCLSQETNLVLTASGRTLEAWTLSSGQLAWRVFSSAGECMCSYSDRIFICYRGHVLALSAWTGATLWRSILSDHQPTGMTCSIDQHHQLRVYATVGQHPSTVHGAVFSTSTGEILRRVEGVAPSPLSHMLRATSDMVVAISANASEACAFPLIPSIRVDCTRLPAQSTFATQHNPLTLVHGTTDVVAMMVQTPRIGAHRFLLISATTRQILELQPSVTAISAPLQSGNVSVLLTLEHTPDGSLSACLVDTATATHTSECKSFRYQAVPSTGSALQASAVWMDLQTVSDLKNARCDTVLVVTCSTRLPLLHCCLRFNL